MGSDLFIVIKWWAAFFLVGSVAFPLTRRLFHAWYDEGYMFSKAVGMAFATYIVWILASMQIIPFGIGPIVFALAVLFVAGLFAWGRHGIQKKILRIELSPKRDRVNIQFSQSRLWWLIPLEEVLFFTALLFWAWVKGHEPDIHGLEKFMDFGFAKSILGTEFGPFRRFGFPPPDMWYAGKTINYYYFGHVVLAVLTRLSGIDLSYTFNLILAALFALTFTMSFSIGYQLFSLSNLTNLSNWKKTAAGLLTAFLVSLAGNMQTLYAFTKGYTGDNVVPFWTVLWKWGEFLQKLPEGLERYWYANATRFIPFTIHEFPIYSFVVSDIHGHVLSLPFTILAIALLLCIFIFRNDQNFGESQEELVRTQSQHPQFDSVRLVFFGVLVGILFMTNALDGPIYLGLFLVLLWVYYSFVQKDTQRHEAGKIAGVVMGAAVLSILPFLVSFKSFVNGVAVNCPPSFLAGKKFGPIIFEEVTKCQHSPLWMLIILWGFFWYCGIWLLIYKIKSSKNWLKGNHAETVLIVFFLYSTALIIFPEFFYFKDIYPAHFRSNTMFKLGYQAFIMFSIISAYVIMQITTGAWGRITKQFSILTSKFSITRKLFVILIIPQIFLVSIYPIFAVRSYFGALKVYKGLDGLNWLKQEYPSDYAAILWLNKLQISSGKTDKKYALVEADGDSYTDYNRISAFTGIPTVVGWAVHEWLWRGGYDVVAPRREEVRRIYESSDVNLARAILHAYNVRFVIIGDMERKKFTALREDKFAEFGRIVFEKGTTRIWEVY